MDAYSRCYIEYSTDDDAFDITCGQFCYPDKDELMYTRMFSAQRGCMFKVLRGSNTRSIY